MNNALIIGGCGFIGYNLTNYLLKNNFDITIIDNLSRETAKINHKKLNKNHSVQFYKLNINNKNKITNIFKSKKFDLIVHLAAQVAVTTSLTDPLNDFKTNVYSTVQILELVRLYQKKSLFIFSSTNKVYGDLADHEITEEVNRYKFKNIKAINETINLSFSTPYGCSKGAADQYVRDYSKSYGLNTVVLRKSCIYGENQYGIEDQGWVSWLLIQIKKNNNINIYGNGKQVRDILHISDLTELYLLLYKNKNKVKGEIFNIGGGIHNTVSINEFLEYTKKLTNNKIRFVFKKERTSDQKVYISDISKIYRKIGWAPKINTKNGIKKIYNWITRELP